MPQIFYSPDFLRYWQDLIDNPRKDMPNPAWLVQHEQAIKPLVWRTWKIARETLPQPCLKCK